MTIYDSVVDYIHPETETHPIFMNTCQRYIAMIKYCAICLSITDKFLYPLPIHPPLFIIDIKGNSFLPYCFKARVLLEPEGDLGFYGK